MKTPIFLIILFVSTSIYAQKDNLYSDKGLSSRYTEKSIKKDRSASKIYNTAKYDEYNPFIELFVEIGISITYGILVESFWEKDLPMHDARFTAYPYFDNLSGNYTYDKTVDNPVKLVLSTNIFAENKYLYGNNFSIQFKFLSRADLSAGYTSFSKHDYAMPIYDVMFHYHRIRMPKLDIWYGLGAMHLGGAVEETGLSVDFGGEWFVKKPISVQAQWQYGFFDYDYNIHKNMFVIKYHLQQFNVQFGAVNYKLGENKINTLSLGLNMYL